MSEKPADVRAFLFPIEIRSRPEEVRQFVHMHYKRVTAAVFATALLISPLVASADTLSDLQSRIDALLSELSSLQSQMQQLQSTSASVSTAGSSSGASTAATGAAPIQCPLIARTIGLGASGSDVSQLQRFLAQQGVFSGDATGYFGTITQAAVQAWQSQHHEQDWISRCSGGTRREHHSAGPGC